MSSGVYTIAVPTGIHTNKVSLLESADLRDALLDAIEAGVPWTTAWRAAGLDYKTLYEWMHAAKTGEWRKQPGIPIRADHLEIICKFIDDVEISRARLEATLVKRVVDAGEQVNAKTGLTDWRANAWVLNNHPQYRESYKLANKEVLAGSGTRPSKPDLSQASEAELIDLAGDEWREIFTPKELPSADTQANNGGAGLSPPLLRGAGEPGDPGPGGPAEEHPGLPPF